MKLIKLANENVIRTEEEKESMIEEMTLHYGRFLTAAGFDWEADPHTQDTPRRVAKAWIQDLIAGSINPAPKVSSFPNNEGYTGLICQTNIPLSSMCAHHNLPFIGICHIAYIPGKDESSKVVGLSKLNRVVRWFASRPNIQESLTKQIHDHIDGLCQGNRGVAVVIESQHNCVRCRGVREDSNMKTSQLSGYFWKNEVGTRTEFFSLINNSRS